MLGSAEPAPPADRAEELTGAALEEALFGPSLCGLVGEPRADGPSEPRRECADSDRIACLDHIAHLKQTAELPANELLSPTEQPELVGDAKLADDGAVQAGRPASPAGQAEAGLDNLRQDAHVVEMPLTPTDLAEELAGQAEQPFQVFELVEAEVPLEHTEAHEQQAEYVEQFLQDVQQALEAMHAEEMTASSAAELATEAPAEQDEPGDHVEVMDFGHVELPREDSQAGRVQHVGQHVELQGAAEMGHGAGASSVDRFEADTSLAPAPVEQMAAPTLPVLHPRTETRISAELALAFALGAAVPGAAPCRGLVAVAPALLALGVPWTSAVDATAALVDATAPATFDALRDGLFADPAEMHRPLHMHEPDLVRATAELFDAPLWRPPAFCIADVRATGHPLPATTVPFLAAIVRSIVGPPAVPNDLYSSLAAYAGEHLGMVLPMASVEPGESRSDGAVGEPGGEAMEIVAGPAQDADSGEGLDLAFPPPADDNLAFASAAPARLLPPLPLLALTSGPSSSTPPPLSATPPQDPLSPSHPRYRSARPRPSELLESAPRARYADLIREAIRASPLRVLALHEVYEAVGAKVADRGRDWKKSVRDNLATKPGFVRIPGPDGQDVPGGFWAVRGEEAAERAAPAVRAPVGMHSKGAGKEQRSSGGEVQQRVPRKEQRPAGKEQRPANDTAQRTADCKPVTKPERPAGEGQHGGKKAQHGARKEQHGARKEQQDSRADQLHDPEKRPAAATAQAPSPAKKRRVIGEEEEGTESSGDEMAAAVGSKAAVRPAHGLENRKPEAKRGGGGAAAPKRKAAEAPAPQPRPAPLILRLPSLVGVQASASDTRSPIAVDTPLQVPGQLCSAPISVPAIGWPGPAALASAPALLIASRALDLGAPEDRGPVGAFSAGPLAGLHRRAPHPARTPIDVVDLTDELRSSSPLASPAASPPAFPRAARMSGTPPDLGPSGPRRRPSAHPTPPPAPAADPEMDRLRAVAADKSSIVASLRTMLSKAEAAEAEAVDACLHRAREARVG